MSAANNVALFKQLPGAVVKTPCTPDVGKKPVIAIGGSEGFCIAVSKQKEPYPEAEGEYACGASYSPAPDT